MTPLAQHLLLITTLTLIIGELSRIADYVSSRFIDDLEFARYQLVIRAIMFSASFAMWYMLVDIEARLGKPISPLAWLVIAGVFALVLNEAWYKNLTFRANCISAVNVLAVIQAGILTEAWVNWIDSFNEVDFMMATWVILGSILLVDGITEGKTQKKLGNALPVIWTGTAIVVFLLILRIGLRFLGALIDSTVGYWIAMYYDEAIWFGLMLAIYWWTYTNRRLDEASKDFNWNLFGLTLLLANIGFSLFIVLNP